MKNLCFVFALLFLQYSFSQTYSSGPVNDSVSDDGMDNDYSINVSGLSPAALDVTHGLVSVCLNMDHTYDGDMFIEIISPSGVHTTLCSGVGGSGHNFTNTCFDMSAATSIISASPPFTGSFVPQGSLGNINNGSIGNGNWILRMRDMGPLDIGYLHDWNITFGGPAPAPFAFTSSNLPIVIINTDGASGISAYPKIGAQLQIVYNGPGIINHTSDTASFVSRIGIKIRGAYSSSLPQKPYGFETWNNMNSDTDVAILGMPKDNDWILQATYNDKVFTRNPQMFKFAREAGQYATRTEHCEVILNGEYQGIYFLCEKIKRDNNRVNVSKNDSANTTLPLISGGYIFKHDYDDWGWTSWWHDAACSTRDMNYQYNYPTAEKINTAQAAYIKNYVDSFEYALLTGSLYDTINGYKKYIDVNSFVDYLLLNEYAKNVDGYKKSMFFHKDFNGKLKAGPIWDFDWALKPLSWYPADMSGWEYLNAPCVGDVLYTPWFARMMEDTTFQNAAKCRWTELRADILDTNNIFGYIDSMANYLDEAQQRHYSYWGHLGINSGAPEYDPVPTTFAGEIDRYKDFLRKRIVWIDANLPGVCRAEPIDTNTISVAEFSNADISVFPNPANEWLYVKSDIIGYQLAEIIDDQGRKILQQKNTSADFWLNVNELRNGLYLLVLSNDDGISTHSKFVINH